MGLLPEIGRAWATLDNRLIVWDYTDSSQSNQYALPDTEVLTGVGLVKPRPGVFVDSIVHLLVLATMTQVHLVGVGFAASAPGAKRGELIFHETNLKVDTDGVRLSVIRGTANGQIFLAGDLPSDQLGYSGCFYGLSYQSSTGWFGKNCTLSNLSTGSAGKSLVPAFFGNHTVSKKDSVVALELDNERNLLYTLHHDNAIKMYRLPASPEGSGYGGTLSSVARWSFNPSFGPVQQIKAIQVIGQKEEGSSRVGLVAITDMGCRYYFAHSGLSALQHLHTRPPPPLIPGVPAPELSAIAGGTHQAIHSAGGFLVAAAAFTEGSDMVLMTAPSVPQRPPVGTVGQAALASAALTELFDPIQVDGTTRAIAEVTVPSLGPALAGRIALNELATPVSQPSRQWLVQTDFASYLVSRLRPIETLLSILKATTSSGDGSKDDLRAYFHTYGRDEFCAMLLTIASSTLIEVNIVDQAKSYLFEAGERPVLIHQGAFGREPQAPTPESTSFSGRHEALVYCFARIIRPIWKDKITRQVAPTPGQPGRQESNFSKEVLSVVGNDLKSLRIFVDQAQNLFTDIFNGAGQDEAYAAEQASLANLQRLLVRADEAISFILLLTDHNIGDIVSTCSDTLQSLLQSLTYQSLITSSEGRDVARDLVRALINQQIKRQLSVDAISDNLQQKCGSFCSADDVLLYKAIQALDRARTPVDDAEREGSLRESLRLFIKAAKHLSIESLTKYCDTYTEMHYPIGAIDLALTCSREWDIPERAYAYWESGSPANDPRAVAFGRRIECGNLVLRALEATDRMVDAAMQHHPPAGSLSFAAADALRTEAYNRAVSSRDEFFHQVLLYSWFIELGRSDKLLELKTPYLEAFLSRDATTAESIYKGDLLWRFYVLASRYPEAAHTLRDLADAPGINLAQRVQYLSFAVGHAKAQYPSSGSDTIQEFVRDVENRLDVAQIQIEIHAVIDGSHTIENRDQLLERLDEVLFSVSDLFNDFAQPLRLHEAMLLILHASDHRDTALVLQLWTEAIAKARDDPIAAKSRPRDLVAAKVTHLARRFHSSEIVFPLFDIVDMLEKYSLENKDEIVVPGWVPLSLQEGGVAWEDLLTAFTALSLKIDSPPWQEASGLVFLARDFATFVDAWLRAAKMSHSIYTDETTFPVAAVRAQLKEYVDALGKRNRMTPGLADVAVQLQDLVKAVGSLRR
ncbi:hypothetical protein RQP46_008408 [Phenoliferia psychrophenolica]